VQEAQAAQSKADFIAKISIAHKEARETGYWLRLLREARVLTAETLDPVADETEQISRILAASLITAKRNSKAGTNACPVAAPHSSL
jgi:four helix bundle protein